MCELCCSEIAYCSIKFENNCPLDNCNKKTSNNEDYHNLCKICFLKYKKLIDFDEKKAEVSLSHLKELTNEHSAAFRKLIENSKKKLNNDKKTYK